MVKTDTQTEVDAKLKERLIKLLGFFDLRPDITINISDNVLVVDVKTGRDELFIRGTADPLLALQHLLRVILRRDFPETRLTISLNIGGFQQYQRDRLAQVAKDAAQQARATKMAVYLPPMSSYERRLVHMALVDEAGITSDSEGEGPERRIVVKLTG